MRSDWREMPWWVWGAVATCIALVTILLAGWWLRDLVLPRAADTADSYLLLSRTVLINRLKDAESRLTATEYQAVLYRSLFDQRATLERELALRPLESYTSARVIARPPRTHFDSLVIDAGSRAGVAVGDLATVNGVALGTVSSVSLETAVVALMSSPGSSRDFFIGEQRAVFVAEGTGGGSFEALIPREVALRSGDAAIDVESGYVSAVLFGVTSSPGDATQKAYLALPVHLNDIDIVSLEHRLL